MAAQPLRSVGAAARACCNSVYVDLRNRSMNSPLSTTGSGCGAGSLRAAGAWPRAPSAGDATPAITTQHEIKRRSTLILDLRAALEFDILNGRDDNGLADDRTIVCRSVRWPR